MSLVDSVCNTNIVSVQNKCRKAVTLKLKWSMRKFL